MKIRERDKEQFKIELNKFAGGLTEYVSTNDKEWTVKGFIDTFRNIYTISADTKIVSKILEIHLFPKFMEFAERTGYVIILSDHQNYYPDMSFVNKDENNIKFAVDLKTTYRLNDFPGFCNGFTLGSHGEYFVNRTSTKNIQFPYNEYSGHFCVCAIYSRTISDKIDETKIYDITKLKSITSVISNIEFLVAEKWEIASDRSGSGNTANIGSINFIEDLTNGNGVFKNLGEDIFDDYWMNYGKITIRDNTGKDKKIMNLDDFLIYKGRKKDVIKINKRPIKRKEKE